jgi:hypothetical protein
LSFRTGLRARWTYFIERMDASLLLVVGQTTADRAVIAAAWLGIVAIAVIVLIASATTPRSLR